MTSTISEETIRKITAAKLAENITNGEINPLDHLDALSDRKWSDTIKVVWDEAIKVSSNTGYSSYTDTMIALLKVKNLDAEYLANQVGQYLSFSQAQKSNLQFQVSFVQAFADKGWDPKYLDTWENIFAGKEGQTVNILNTLASSALQIFSKIQNVPDQTISRIINKLYSFSWNTDPISSSLLDVLSRQNRFDLDNSVLARSADILHSNILTNLKSAELTKNSLLSMLKVIDAIYLLIQPAEQEELFKLLVDVTNKLKVQKSDIDKDGLGISGKAIAIANHSYHGLEFSDVNLLLQKDSNINFDDLIKIFRQINKSAAALNEISRRASLAETVEEYVIYSSLVAEYTDEQINGLADNNQINTRHQNILKYLTYGIQPSRVSNHHEEIINRLLSSDESYSVKSSLFNKFAGLTTERTGEFGFLEYVVSRLGTNRLLDKLFFEYAISEKFEGSEIDFVEKFRILSSVNILNAESVYLISKNFLLRATEHHERLMVADLISQHRHISSFEEIWIDLISKTSKTDDIFQRLNKVQNIPNEFIAKLVLDTLSTSNIKNNPALVQVIVSTLLKATYDEHIKKAWFFLEKDRLTTIQAIESDTSSFGAKFLSEETSTVERLASFYGSLLQNPKLASLLSQTRVHYGFDKLVSETLQESQVIPDNLVKIIRECVTEAINSGTHIPILDRNLKAFPRAVFEAPDAAGILTDSSSKIAIIGGGPAAILYSTMSRLIARRGGSNVTIINKSSNDGGIWTQDNVVDEGHNTFRALDVFGAKLSNQEPRPGKDLVNFLRTLSERNNNRTIEGDVKSVRYSEKTGKYQIYINGHDAPLSFDSVVIATGNEVPKPLNDSRMITNYTKQDYPRIPVRRWQMQIDESKYSEYEGTSPVIIGLGNSTMAMIGEFLKMREAGIDVNPVILTHYSDTAVQNPHKAVLGKNKEVEGPIFRGYFDLSKVAGDIERISDRYFRALSLGWIKPAVTEWNIVGVDNQTRTCDILVKHENLQSELIENVYGVWALIGYTNSSETMKSFGLQIDDTGHAIFDSVTQRAHTQFTQDPDRVYIIGAAASRKGDRNREVIPGMMNSIAMTLLADLLKAQAR